MFEQSLYEHPQDETPIETPIEAPQEVAHEEGGLFSTYEVKNWSFGPRIYKILGASAVFNLLAVAIFTQGSLMTMKGCDSPLVGSVCKVLDTVYVGAVLFGTERDMIDQDYEKTELANATMVFTEMPPESEKISYPEGYFAVADPIAWQAKLDALNALNNPTETVQPGYLAPGIPNNNSTIGIPTTSPYKPGRSILDTPPKRLNPNKGTIDASKLPQGINDEGDDVAVKQPNGKPNGTGVRPNGADPASNANATIPKKPKFDPNTIPQEEASEQFGGIRVNKRPLKVFKGENLDKIEAISPDVPFAVTVTAELAPGKKPDGSESGTIVLTNVNQQSARSKDKKRAEMEKLAVDGLLALGDSGWLGYLYKFETRKVLISVQQNADQFTFVLRGDQTSDQSAKSNADGLNGLKSLGKAGKTGDELAFLENASVKSEGKNIIVSFTMATQEVHAMIKRALEGADKKDGNAGQNAVRSQNLGK